jgi:hypothetical protein
VIWPAIIAGPSKWKKSGEKCLAPVLQSPEWKTKVESD